MMPEETNMLIIEETDASTINVTLLNLAVEGNKIATTLRELKKNDPSAIIALLIPPYLADDGIVIEAVTAGAKAYIKKPAPDIVNKRRATNNLIGSERR
jgi:DNA-binding NarL/FixJ family response regulator